MQSAFKALSSPCPESKRKAQSTLSRGALNQAKRKCPLFASVGKAECFEKWIYSDQHTPKGPLF